MKHAKQNTRFYNIFFAFYNNLNSYVRFSDVRGKRNSFSPKHYLIGDNHATRGSNNSLVHAIFLKSVNRAVSMLIFN